MRSSSPRYLLIANPGTKRCETYCRELRQFWAARDCDASIEVVPWAEVVVRDGNLDSLDVFDRPAIVRLESPGKDENVMRLLLEAGARDDPSEPPCDWRALELPKGLLVGPGLWFRGFHRVLRGLRHSFDARPHLQPTACPLAVAAMFDKTRTSQLLDDADIPVPDRLQHPPDVYAYLVTDGPDRWQAAYLKLNTGSSAIGMAVIHRDRQHIRLIGTTTVAEHGGRFWNTRRLRRVSGPELDRIGEFILSEGAIVQRGIPMAQIDGLNFDVRVVCVYGEPAAMIFRLSPHPMTNLQLGGHRGDFARCRAAIPTRQWLDAIDHCAEAAACFESAVAGVDLVFERGLGRHYILEVNAFGDFFPGWTDELGRSLHSLEIAATASRLG